MPDHPKKNDFVERVNHTIKSATITSYQYASVEDLKQALDDYLCYDNLQRKQGNSLQKAV